MQAQGEWTEDEHRLFVETARAHGVGDKWGLFASHLRQRVGYQCSAYYRQAAPTGGPGRLGGPAAWVGRMIVAWVGATSSTQGQRRVLPCQCPTAAPSA